VISYWNLFVVDSGRPYTESYKLIKKIGQGGCGEVFMVMHLPTDQIRAMKIVSKTSDKVVKTVYDELMILKQLDHPNIVKVFEYFQDDKNIYVIMEYIKGGSIFDKIKITGRFGERESAIIIKQILSALNYLSEKKIVHRDLKLENILFV
jgi:calcium-dependent protein kinase